MTDPTPDRDDTRTRVVAVAAALLHEGGARAVTTRAVAEAAGVQAPTIYRLFGDKEGLLDAVADHAMTAFTSRKADAARQAAAQDVEPLAELHAAWERTIGFWLDHPALFVLLTDPERGARSPAVEAGQRQLRDRLHRVALTGRLAVPEQRAVELVHAAGTGAVLSILSTPEGRRDRSVADVMLRAVLSQVLTDPPAPTSDAPTAAAVALRARLPDLDVLSTAERQLMAEWLDRVVGAGG